MKISLKSTALLLAPMLALLTACGGGKSSSSTTATPTLLSIAVTPTTPTVAVGLTQQMTATGTYSDGKTAAITADLTWSVKGSNISVLPATGLVTGVAIGSDTVTAKVGTVTGSTDVAVRGPWDAITAGGNHTVARRADGSLYAWGWNRQGQLGDGSNNDHTRPVIVSGGVLTWKQVAIGELHTLALRSDGTLWAWGFNQNGQLGDGTTVDKNVPVQVGSAKDWVFIAAGKSHSLAINKTGLLYGWGRNFNGQVGDNTKIDRLVPTKVVPAGAAATTFTSVSAGDAHTLARSSDGSLWVWGGNAKSQLGNGATADLQQPTKIVVPKSATDVTASTWASVAAGGTHSLAIRADGTLWAWGDNSSGQLGIPTTNTAVTATAPTQVGSASGWSMIAAGQSHSLALRTDGTLWGWGANGNGQVGINNTGNVGAPVQIGAAITWVSISAGLQHSAALQKDNTVWLWGRNTEGQQGNGTQNDVTSPVSLQFP